MLNNLIVWSRTGKEGSQHAYFPKRGVATAWREVMDNLPKWDFIYEIDLKGFFDNVKLSYIEQELISKHGYPKSEAERLTALNQSVPKLRDQDLTIERDRNVALLPSGQLSGTRAEISQDKILDLYLLSRQIAARGTESVRDDYYHNDHQGFDAESHFWDEYFQEDDLQVLKQAGVPQGAATSCSLSTVANEQHACIRVVHQQIGPPIIILEVFYADDALVFSNSANCINHLSDEKAGLMVSEPKSKWIKFNGM